MIDAKDVMAKYTKIREKQLVGMVEHQDIRLYNLLGVLLDSETERNLRQADFEANQPLYDECTYKPKKKAGDRVLEWEEVRTSEEEMLNDEIMIRYKYIIERYTFSINNFEDVMDKMFFNTSSKAASKSKIVNQVREFPLTFLDMDLVEIRNEMRERAEFVSDGLIAKVLDAVIKHQKKDKTKKVQMQDGYSVLYNGTYDIGIKDSRFKTAKDAWYNALRGVENIEIKFVPMTLS